MLSGIPATIQIRHHGHRNGFALVLSLSLMSFVLLLLLAITSLVRVESAASTQSLDRFLVEQNARLALMIALGELQRHAGPDQRITARADILGPDIANPFWTGVWNTEEPTSPPRWLVSSNNNGPRSTTRQQATDQIQLVGPQTAGANTAHHVSAPALYLTQSSNTHTRIGWWIADQGVKASVGGLPLNKLSTPNYQSDRRIKSLELLLASSHGLEELFTSYDRFDSAKGSALDQIHSLNDLVSARVFSDKSSHAFSNEPLFHTLSIANYGVLASVLPSSDGGLMRDLSLYPDIIGSGLKNYVELAEANKRALNQSTSALGEYRLLSQLRGLDQLGPLTDGMIATPITPILSNFLMAFTLRSHSPVSQNPNMYLRMRFFCELWNPYTNGLAMHDKTGNPLDLELEITGLPTVRAIKTTGNRASSDPVDLQSVLGAPNSPTGAMIIRLQYDHSRQWLSGQTMNWTGVNADETAGPSPYHSTTTTSKQWDAPENTLGGSRGIDTGIARVSGNFRHTSSEINNIHIKLYAVNTVLNSRTLLSEYGDLSYEPISTRLDGYSNTHSGSTFGYHFILRGPHLSTQDRHYYRGRWLHDHDPRNPQPIFHPDWHLDNDPTVPSGSPYTAVRDGITPLPVPAPEEINETNNTLNTEIFRRILDRSWGNSLSFNKLWQDTPVFELPRQRPLSLASLQHLYFHNERPFQVGNSWGANGRVNTSDWFDRYYFSGFHRDDDPAVFSPEAPLPNPALISYPQTDDIGLASWISATPSSSVEARNPASRLMVKNRFNVNSTSTAAWKAVLGSLRINGWSYLDYPDDTADLSSLSLKQDGRGGMFSRYSHTLCETYDSIASPKFEGSEPVAPSAYYRRGARHLHSSELERLATEIVRLLQDRAEPFFSMSDFLSAQEGSELSLLEQAIANTLSKEGRQQWDHEWETNGRWPKVAAEQVDIDHFSPGYLTQADIMSAIGPMLAPRSDTFKIRARAETRTPDQRTYSATIEAIAQRLPTALEPGNADHGPLNRRLKLISLRWLADDEL